MASWTMRCRCRGLGERARLFVRGITGRDEQDAIQLQELSGRLGNREVAPVDRIKTAP
jgi:hypothetical protein